jgi:hypothetical protein
LWNFFCNVLFCDFAVQDALFHTLIDSKLTDANNLNRLADAMNGYALIFLGGVPPGIDDKTDDAATKLRPSPPAAMDIKRTVPLLSSSVSPFSKLGWRLDRNWSSTTMHVPSSWGYRPVEEGNTVPCAGFPSDQKTRYWEKEGLWTLGRAANRQLFHQWLILELSAPFRHSLKLYERQRADSLLCVPASPS